MSTADLEKFIKYMVQVPELVDSLGYFEAVRAPSFDRAVAFAAGAVREGRELGLDFSEDECRAWLDNKVTNFVDGELSEYELDAVAGGGRTTTTTTTTLRSSTLLRR